MKIYLKNEKEKFKLELKQRTIKDYNNMNAAVVDYINKKMEQIINQTNIPM